MSISFCIINYKPSIYSLPESRQSKEYFHDQEPVVEDCFDEKGIECFPSKIHQNGQNVVNTELRHSLSSENNLIISKPDFFHDYFSKVKIGKGRKHIYTQDMFMKPHYDFQKAPLINHYLGDYDETTRSRQKLTEELPHWGTLIVTNDIDRFLIMGKKVIITPYKYCYSSPSNCYWIIINLHCKHEVTLDYSRNSNRTRQSYSFPIYGYYSGINQVLKERVRDIIPTISPYQSILDYIHQYSKTNKKSDDMEEYIKRMDALVSVLDDVECQEIVNQLRIVHGIPEKQQNRYDWNSDLSSSDDDDSIDESSLWETLRLRIMSLEQHFQKHPRRPKNNTKALKWIPDSLQKGINEFTVVLDGDYILGDGPEHLCPVDRSLYDFLSSYQNNSLTMHVIPVDKLPMNGVFHIQEQYFKKEHGSLKLFEDQYSFSSNDLPGIGQIIDLCTEFNDEGEYEPEFQRLVGVLYVEPVTITPFLVALQNTMKEDNLFTKNAFTQVFRFLYSK